MPHTDRPLMSNSTVVPNPEVVQAQSPTSMNVMANAEPDATGNPATPNPEAPVNHDWEKRYKDLQSFSSKQMNEKEAEIANLLRDKARGPEFQVPKTAEEIAAFKAENPETYAFIETIAYDRANNQTQVINDRLEAAESTLATNSREQAMTQLRQAHPDFEEINGHPSFNQWLATQDVEVQGWIYHNSDDANKVNRALSLFKQDTGWSGSNTLDTNVNVSTNVNQQTNVDASRSVDVSSDSVGNGDPRKHPAYIWKEAEINKLYPTDYAKYSEDIDLAMSEGRVAMG